MSRQGYNYLIAILAWLFLIAGGCLIGNHWQVGLGAVIFGTSFSNI